MSNGSIPNLGFNPRSQQHSTALSRFILDDLQRMSPRIAADITTGKIVPRLNANVATRITVRNVDLVLRDEDLPGPLDQVRAAVEHKTLMTAHGKARKNRLGDIVAYANHVHNHNLHAIATATMIVNTSPAYENPDEFARKLIRPSGTPERWQQLIEGTMRLYAALPLRDRADEPNDQPEALTIALIDYDGRNPARLITASPAPQPGSPTFLLDFYERIIRLYEERF